MSAWLRELAGWILLGIGLAIFALVYMFLVNKRVIEGFLFGVVGIMVFRAGIGLLKVAVAARAMHEVKRDMAEAGTIRKKPARIQLGRKELPGRTTESVLPGPKG